MMTSEETMDLLSSVRLGVNLRLLDDINISTLNELFIHTQPAHLQKLMGASLDGEERNAARAQYLRTRLREGDANPN
jgi:protein arginine kinase